MLQRERKKTTHGRSGLTRLSSGSSEALSTLMDSTKRQIGEMKRQLLVISQKKSEVLTNLQGHQQVQENHENPLDPVDGDKKQVRHL